MGLPLKVREIIYGDLLTVPSLICLRQNQTVHSKEDGAYVFAEHRELLSGISFALTQTAVDGLKSRVHRHESFNIAILRVSRQVFTETRKVFYGCNEFQLFNRTPETSPPVDFSVPLFPPGYARFVKNITICAHHVYGLGYLLKGGHKDLKNRYRNLQRLTLVLELESSIKNYGKQFTRARSEDWPTYVARVQAILQQETYNCQGISKSVPSWVELKALFIGDRYIEGHKNSNINRPTLVASDELTRRAEIKSAITDAFNHFKRSY
ncbi:hypothetical protein BU24DRAFT_420180 [Aaosphaeria arxii CBS 175.79]|uniref:Uncharacterized protein n=1 Tax=Aaosphaeria arxii CBS 175.79 TaxID=1450172 RepID=A0A6A5XY00_9PLEO|nr:uncharacterized protein BU24DRAFT_420180 [Aaosphaeria arxii CBS 175.79]KAF2017154.1 hypothetical protein BU24DRAFT_420180 [Aaosphaeria arxii CBS 175.79]